AASVVGDHTVAMRQEEQHLVVPVVAAERPSVMKDDRLGILGAPVFIENTGVVASRDFSHSRISLVMSKVCICHIDTDAGPADLLHKRGGAGLSFEKSDASILSVAF